MQTTTFHRLSQVSGIIAAVLLALLLVGTDTGRNALAWMYLQSTDAIANAAHIPHFPWTGSTQPARSACSSTQPQEAL
jgi:hypothetical protein